MHLGDLAHLLVQKHSPLLQAIAEEMESNLKVAQMGSHAGMWVEFAQVEHSIKPPRCNHCFLEPACNSGVCRPSQPQGLDAGRAHRGETFLHLLSLSWGESARVRHSLVHFLVEATCLLMRICCSCCCLFRGNFGRQ